LQGLGDAVEIVTKATGIDKVAKFVLGEDCGCEERKAKLNKLFPIGRQPKECMTENEYQRWGELRASTTDTLSKEEADLVAQLWNKLFNTRKFYRPCTCNPKEWQRMVNDIHQVYDTYAAGS
jgi:hypothetical protein